MDTAIEEIVSFWFSSESKVYWFKKHPAFDEAIRTRFLSRYEEARDEMLWGWKNTPKGVLALIILLDQFPRNLFRESKKAYATDDKALKLTKYAIERGYDKELSEEQRIFVYMPLMHSEKLEDQKQSVLLFSHPGFEYSLEYAQMHKMIIDRFGRFPHRNNAMERPSTPEEIEFLMGPNSSF